MVQRECGHTFHMRTWVSLAWSTLGRTCSLGCLALLSAACGGGDKGGGDNTKDAGSDATTDGASDATVDSAEPGDAGPDTSTEDATADTGETDAGTDANDGAVGADAADAGIACTPIANVGSIYYSRGTRYATPGELWRATGSGASDVKIGAGYWPRLSHDGRFLVYKNEDPDNEYYRGNLWVRDLAPPADAGAGPFDTRILSQPGVYTTYYDWTNDNASIYFDVQNVIDRMSRNGTNRETVIRYRESDGWSDWPTVNPVDGRVAWHNIYDGLGISAADGSGAAHIPNTLPTVIAVDGGPELHTAFGDWGPSWTPDGQWLVFVQKNYDDYQGKVVKIRPNGADRTIVTPLFITNEGFRNGAVTPDGTKYVGAGVYQGVNGIYAVPLDGSGTVERVCTVTSGLPVDFVGSVTAP